MNQVTALSGLYLLRLQVALIYFEASVAKLSVPEWRNGTALDYWFTNPGFGMPDWLHPIAMPILTNQVGVTTATWGVIVLESTLFLGLTMAKPWRRILLPVALLFHLGIAVVHGLGIFFLSMAGALIVYLWPYEDEFNWERVRTSMRVLPVRLQGWARRADATVSADA